MGAIHEVSLFQGSSYFIPYGFPSDNHIVSYFDCSLRAGNRILLAFSVQKGCSRKFEKLDVCVFICCWHAVFVLGPAFFS